MEELRFSDAMKAFIVICAIEPHLYSNWASLGHSAFHSEQYDVALMAYYIATSLNPDTPYPLIWASNVCEKTKENEPALEMLKRAKVLAEESKLKEERSLILDINEKIALLSLASKK